MDENIFTEGYVDGFSDVFIEENKEEIVLFPDEDVDSEVQEEAETSESEDLESFQITDRSVDEQVLFPLTATVEGNGAGYYDLDQDGSDNEITESNLPVLLYETGSSQTEEKEVDYSIILGDIKLGISNLNEELDRLEYVVGYKVEEVHGNTQTIMFVDCAIFGALVIAIIFTKVIV